VKGYGVWANGKWRVIFSRDLASTEAADVSFAPGKVYSLAFAAWDGANGERNGQKSTSQWVSLQLEGAAPAVRPAQPAAAPFDWTGLAYVFAPMVLVTFLILGLVGGVALLAAWVKRQ
jgi:complex iron-sulfur molybdoenzyme family reductase subunit gamma